MFIYKYIILTLVYFSSCCSCNRLALWQSFEGWCNATYLYIVINVRVFLSSNSTYKQTNLGHDLGECLSNYLRVPVYILSLHSLCFYFSLFLCDTF